MKKPPFYRGMRVVIAGRLWNEGLPMGEVATGTITDSRTDVYAYVQLDYIPLYRRGYTPTLQSPPKVLIAFADLEPWE